MFFHLCHLRPYLVLLAAAALHRLQCVYRHSTFDEIGSNGVCVCVLFCRELSGDCGLDAKLLLEQLLLIRQSLDVLFV